MNNHQNNHKELSGPFRAAPLVRPALLVGLAAQSLAPPMATLSSSAAYIAFAALPLGGLLCVLTFTKVCRLCGEQMGKKTVHVADAHSTRSTVSPSDSWATARSDRLRTSFEELKRFLDDVPRTYEDGMANGRADEVAWMEESGLYQSVANNHRATSAAARA